jgi:hypothetical protein
LIADANGELISSEGKDLADPRRPVGSLDQNERAVTFKGGGSTRRRLGNRAVRVVGEEAQALDADDALLDATARRERPPGLRLSLRSCSSRI